MEIIKNGFKNERLGIELDVYLIESGEWFRAKDISDFLGYQDTNKMMRSIEITEFNCIRQTLSGVNNNKYEADFINESALYEIIFSITKRDMVRYAKAREFQKWVFSEVLPSIRKNGMYAVADITKEQIELYAEENREFKRVMMNMKSGLARSKSLEVWVKEIAPVIEDAYEQVLEQLKLIGVIDDKCMPTEKFKEANRHGKWFSHNIKTTSDTTIKITLLEKGIMIMSKIVKVVNGKILLEKFKYDLKLS